MGDRDLRASLVSEDALSVGVVSRAAAQGETQHIPASKAERRLR